MIECQVFFFVLRQAEVRQDCSYFIACYITYLVNWGWLKWGWLDVCYALQSLHCQWCTLTRDKDKSGWHGVWAASEPPGHCLVAAPGQGSPGTPAQSPGSGLCPPGTRTVLRRWLTKCLSLVLRRFWNLWWSDSHGSLGVQWYWSVHF